MHISFLAFVSRSWRHIGCSTGTCSGDRCASFVLVARIAVGPADAAACRSTAGRWAARWSARTVTTAGLALHALSFLADAGAVYRRSGLACQRRRHTGTARLVAVLAGGASCRSTDASTVRIKTIVTRWRRRRAGVFDRGNLARVWSRLVARLCGPLPTRGRCCQAQRTTSGWLSCVPIGVPERRPIRPFPRRVLVIVAAADPVLPGTARRYLVLEETACEGTTDGRQMASQTGATPFRGVPMRSLRNEFIAVGQGRSLNEALATSPIDCDGGGKQQEETSHR